MRILTVLPSVIYITMTINITMVTRAEDSIKDTTYFNEKEGINCLNCPPGTYLVAHCTPETYQAKCHRCENGTFQMYHSVTESCQACRRSCKREDREDLVENCTATTDNYCVCKPGYYRDQTPNGQCLLFSKCPAGQGVSKPGTLIEDTKCEVCKDGYFSPNKSATQICQPCSTCDEEFVTEVQCSKKSDTVCVPKDDTGSIGLILGVVVGIIVIFLILFVVIFLRARRGQGLLCLTHCCTKRKNSDLENSPEKTPLSAIEKPANSHSHNGMTNGDVVDKPESPNGNFTQDPPGVVPDKTLISLSHDLISPEWPFFFRNLIGESADTFIDESIIDNKGVREQIYKLLVKWKHMRKGKATMDEILAALKETGKNELALKYSTDRSTDV